VAANMDNRIKIHLILGARPNQMKVAPLFKMLKSSSDFEPQVIDTGQHFDTNMSSIFLSEFEMPAPFAELKVGSGSHAVQTGKTMISYEELCMKSKPAWTIVFGDVNSTLACGLVAAKLHIPVAHAEAGLRSRDRTMPEEINRIVTDSISSLLWTTSQDANENLANEGHDAGSVSLVGNLMIDSLVTMMPKIIKSEKFVTLGLKEKDYCVVTFHRPSNVDNDQALLVLVKQLVELSKNIEVVFPVHPRTKQALIRVGKLEKLEETRNIQVLEPQGYIDFINLVLHARFVITDSGGVQEETAFLQIPCFTVRDTTERPITLSQGRNELISGELISSLVFRGLQDASKMNAIPFWDGNAAKRAIEHLRLNLR